MILSDKERIILKANDFSVGKSNLLNKTNFFKKKVKKVEKVRTKKNTEKKFGIILQIYKPGEFNLANLKGKKFFS